jgi:uncharacterized protein
VRGDAPGREVTGRRRRWGLAPGLVAAGLLVAACAGTSGVAPTTTAPAAGSSSTTTVPAGTEPPSTTTSSTTTTTAPTTTTSTTLPAWWREVTPDDPLQVWVIGDSLAGPVGSALSARVAEAGLIRVQVHGEGGTGLARPDVFDWPGFVADGLAGASPDVVVVILGANDGQGFSSEGSRVEFGTAEWDGRYRERVGALMDQLLASALRVYWVGLPIMREPEYDARLRHISTILRWEASLRLDARFIEAYSLFQGGDGAFAFELPDESGVLVTVRAADGIHYTWAGADRMAQRVLKVLEADWRLGAG